MPKFIYLGPASETDAFGIEFPKGEAVEVTEPYAVKKLTGNPCFKAAGEDKPKAPTVADLLPIIAAATLEELAALGEGETRKMVTDAIAKRKAELQPAQ